MDSYPRLGNGKDYGLMPQPTDARTCLEFLARKITGDIPISVNPISEEQYNTQLTEYILTYVDSKLACNRCCPMKKSHNRLKIHELDYIKTFEEI